MSGEGLYDVYQEIKHFIVNSVRLMNWRRAIMKLIIVVAVIAAFIGGCSYLNQLAGLKDDNVIEEATEDVIEHETGVRIDLTPGSPEVIL